MQQFLNSLQTPLTFQELCASRNLELSAEDVAAELVAGVNAGTLGYIIDSSGSNVPHLRFTAQARVLVAPSDEAVNAVEFLLEHPETAKSLAAEGAGVDPARLHLALRPKYYPGEILWALQKLTASRVLTFALDARTSQARVVLAEQRRFSVLCYLPDSGTQYCYHVRAGSPDAAVDKVWESRDLRYSAPEVLGVFAGLQQPLATRDMKAAKTRWIA